MSRHPRLLQRTWVRVQDAIIQNKGTEKTHPRIGTLTDHQSRTSRNPIFDRVISRSQQRPDHKLQMRLSSQSSNPSTFPRQSSTKSTVSANWTRTVTRLDPYPRVAGRNRLVAVGMSRPDWKPGPRKEAEFIPAENPSPQGVGVKQRV